MAIKIYEIMGITRQEYVAALDIVEAYHKQILNGHNNLSKNLIDHKFMLFLIDRISPNKIIQFRKYLSQSLVLYIEDINYDILSSYPSFGKIGIEKIKYLIKLYLQ